MELSQTQSFLYDLWSLKKKNLLSLDFFPNRR